MVPLKDKSISLRIYILILFRVFIKILIIISALFMHVNYNVFLIILALVFVSELYKNIASRLIIKYGNIKHIGSITSALDGALIMLSINFINGLNSDIYLFAILSIALNAAEYGFLSAIIEGIVVGFSYTVFLILSPLGYDISAYLLRIVFLTCFGWLIGWLTNELTDKEGKLELVLEDNIHEEALNEIKEDFVNDAAESLKTPISAIRGYIDLMVNDRLGAINPDIKVYLNKISKNIFEIDSLTEELLHIIEIENDKIKLNKQTVKVEEVIAYIKENIEAFSKIRGNEINVENISIDDEKTISIDEYKVKLSIKNILFYIFNISQGNISISFVNEEKGININISSIIRDISNLDIFDSSGETNFEKLKEKNSMLKVYTSKLIIESHEGSVAIKKTQDGKIILNIYIPYNN